MEKSTKTQHLYLGKVTRNDEMIDIKIDMTDIHEQDNATHPVNWRVIQEEFPNTVGEMRVSDCICQYNNPKNNPWILVT